MRSSSLPPLPSAQVSYKLTQSRKYSLSVCLGRDGSPICGSPWELVVAPAATAARASVLSGPGLQCAIAGELATFEVEARDRFNNSQLFANEAWTATIEPSELRADAKGAAASSMPVQLVERGDSAIVATYRATVAGTYRLSVCLGGVHAIGSPFVTTIRAADLVPACSELQDVTQLSRVRRGEELSIVVVGRDKYGNACGANGNVSFCTARLRPPLQAQRVPETRVEHRKDGTFLLTLTPETRGKHTLAVAIDQTPIKGSDFIFDVR